MPTRLPPNLSLILPASAWTALSVRPCRSRPIFVRPPSCPPLYRFACSDFIASSTENPRIARPEPSSVPPPLSITTFHRLSPRHCRHSSLEVRMSCCIIAIVPVVPLCLRLSRTQDSRGPAYTDGSRSCVSTLPTDFSPPFPPPFPLFTITSFYIRLSLPSIHRAATAASMIPLPAPFPHPGRPATFAGSPPDGQWPVALTSPTFLHPFRTYVYLVYAPDLTLRRRSTAGAEVTYSFP
ncbi:hypothetical protein C2E23DRAFT_114690 [Lenzites betulinus]|nr:hypothetical protein C2E23DRAFT_114690 [Lenzites betulinus]